MQVGEERVCSSYISTLSSFIEGSQGRNTNKVVTRRQELMQRPWKDAAYWLTPHGLLSLLSYRTHGHQPRDGPIYIDGPSIINH